MDNFKITSQLIRDIINGKLNLEEVQRKIAELEAEYGKDFFVDYDIEKKEKPWDEKYLHDLEIKSMAGMSSKQFILHLAEVSEFVHSSKYKREKKSSNSPKKSMRKIIIFIIAGVIAVLTVAFFVSKNMNTKSAHNAAKKSAESVVKIIVEVRPTSDSLKKQNNNNSEAVHVGADLSNATQVSNITVVKGE